MSRDLSRGRYSRRRWQAGQRVLHQNASLGAKRGRGREREPIEWTGWAARLEWETEGKPGLASHDSGHECLKEHGSHGAPGRPEKPLARCVFCPYRIPTPVGRGNPPKVNERTSVKELGKLTPYLRKKGCPSSLLSLCAGTGSERAAGNWLKRLFTKNTGLCERASGSIGADSCPVPEG